MKKYLLLICLILRVNSLYADTPACYRFKVELTLLDGSILKGEHFHYGMYLSINDTSSFIDVLDWIKYINKTTGSNRKVVIFKNIDTLRNPKCAESFDFFYCLKENTVELDISQIKEYKELEKSGCHPNNNLNWEYAGGCRPEVITELEASEIKQLNSKPKIEIQTGYEFEEYFGAFSIVYILSYGEKQENAIFEMINSFLEESNLKNIENPDMTENQYNALKKILRNDDIIMFRTFYYN